MLLSGCEGEAVRSDKILLYKISLSSGLSKAFKAVLKVLKPKAKAFRRLLKNL